MTEQHPLVRGHEVVAVVEPLRGCGAAGIEAEDFVREELRVEAVTDDVGTDGGGEEPGGADRLAAGQRQDTEGDGPQHRNRDPNKRPPPPARKLWRRLPMFKF